MKKQLVASTIDKKLGSCALNADILNPLPAHREAPTVAETPAYNQSCMAYVTLPVLPELEYKFTLFFLTSDKEAHCSVLYDYETLSLLSCI